MGPGNKAILLPLSTEQLLHCSSHPTPEASKVHFHTPYLSSDHLALLVHPLHGGCGEEGEDETKGADEVPREGVDQRKLLEDHCRAMEAGKKNHWCVERGLRGGRDEGGE